MVVICRVKCLPKSIVGNFILNALGHVNIYSFLLNPRPSEQYEFTHKQKMPLRLISLGIEDDFVMQKAVADSEGWGEIKPDCVKNLLKKIS